MPKKDKLYILVHSLNTNEKKSVKQYLKKQGVSSKYASLIDAVAKMETPDNKLLQEKLKKHEWSSRIRPLKSECFELCLDALVAYRGDIQNESEWLRRFARAEVLFGCGMIKDAEKITSGAVDRCIERGRFGLASDGLTLVLRRLMRLGFKKYRNSIVEVNKRLSEVQSFAKMDAANSLLAQEVLLVHRTHGRGYQLESSLFTKVDSAMLLSSESEIPNIISQRLCSTMSAYCELVGDADKALEFRLQGLHLLKERYLQGLESTMSILTNTYNAASTCFRSGKMQEYQELRCFLEEIPTPDTHTRMEQIQDLFLLDTVFKLNHTFERSWNSLWNEFRTCLEDNFLFAAGPCKAIITNIALGFFLDKQWGKSIEVLQHLDLQDREQRVDLNQKAAILRLLCHTELGNEMVVDSLVRKMKSEFAANSVGNIVANYANRVSSTPFEKQTIVENAQQELKDLLSAEDTTPIQLLGRYELEDYFSLF